MLSYANFVRTLQNSKSCPQNALIAFIYWTFGCVCGLGVCNTSKLFFLCASSQASFNAKLLLLLSISLLSNGFPKKTQVILKNARRNSRFWPALVPSPCRLETMTQTIAERFKLKTPQMHNTTLFATRRSHHVSRHSCNVRRTIKI